MIQRFFFLLCFLFSLKAYAEDPFHSEADAELLAGKAWAVTRFVDDQTAETAFRAWFPYNSEQVWEVLTDTNAYKRIISDYTDSLTLTEAQFKQVQDQKPKDIKKTYEIIGAERPPSTQGRSKGKLWTGYALVRLNLPWPVADRWAVLKIINDERNSKSGKYRYDYEIIAGNFEKFKGYWELLPAPQKPGWVEFRGEYQADPGIPVPQFMAKKIFPSSLKKAVKANTQEMGKRFGAPQP